MRPELKALFVAAGVAAVLAGCTVFKPALADTNERETEGVRVAAYGAEQPPGENFLVGEVIGPVLDFVSTGLQTAIDSDQARYSAVYTGSVVIADFWDGEKAKYQGLGAQRLMPGRVASTFTIALEPWADNPGKFLVRPTEATIDRAMAKLLKGGVLSLGSWFGDTTTLLNVEVKWKVEDLSAKDESSTEATVSIGGYDMDELVDGKHPNYFEMKKGKQAPLAGVLAFPRPDKGHGLYRVTVTVTEKDPLNVDRSVEAEKTLVKDLIDALKKTQDSSDS